MRLIGLAVILAVSLFAAPLAAQQRPAEARIGFLGTPSPPNLAAGFEALRAVQGAARDALRQTEEGRQ